MSNNNQNDTVFKKSSKAIQWNTGYSKNDFNNQYEAPNKVSSGFSSSHPLRILKKKAVPEVDVNQLFFMDDTERFTNIPGYAELASGLEEMQEREAQLAYDYQVKGIREHVNLQVYLNAQQKQAFDLEMSEKLQAIDEKINSMPGLSADEKKELRKEEIKKLYKSDLVQKKPEPLPYNRFSFLTNKQIRGKIETYLRNVIEYGDYVEKKSDYYTSYLKDEFRKSKNVVQTAELLLADLQATKPADKKGEILDKKAERRARDEAEEGKDDGEGIEPSTGKRAGRKGKGKGRK